jgi:hypothetical protein
LTNLLLSNASHEGMTGVSDNRVADHIFTNPSPDAPESHHQVRAFVKASVYTNDEGCIVTWNSL